MGISRYKGFLCRVFCRWTPSSRSVWALYCLSGQFSQGSNLFFCFCFRDPRTRTPCSRPRCPSGISGQNSDDAYLFVNASTFSVPYLVRRNDPMTTHVKGGAWNAHLTIVFSHRPSHGASISPSKRCIWVPCHVPHLSIGNVPPNPRCRSISRLLVVLLRLCCRGG